jgi:hypothetical protein
VGGLTNADKRAITQFVPFVEVGSVGPDYPYLGQQSEWANRMHYNATGEVIRNGVRILREFDAGPARSRCLSWLLGYAAHVATDLTIHPVVKLRVGPYASNKTAHRTCEMHQDAFIWEQRNLGDIGLADRFRINIEHCSAEDGGLNADVTGLWQRMLEMSYPDDFVAEPPNISRWNRGFKGIVDSIDDLGRLVPFTRHMLAAGAAAYPSPDDVDPSFIENLRTPEGPQHYNEIFDRAVDSIVSVWAVVGRALRARTLAGAENALEGIPDGNLDTGIQLAGDAQIFWNLV